MRVLAREADGERAVPVEQADQLALDLPGEDHPYDVHRLGRRDAQARAELADQALLVELGADLRAAAVHDDGAEPGVPQEDDVLREGGLQPLVDHGVAAELDDDGLALVAGDPGEGLDQGLGLGEGGVLAGRTGGRLGHNTRLALVAGLAHEEYALFSWT
ncbi:hypothetical protein GA0115246_1082712 [Streptomyces sp. SolWspMP-sol7th]|nr:hypothetical protein GA0115246_1082712 [Streptomyces sp. SolWspMP-sol7th]